MYLACWVRIILLGKDSKRVIHIFNQRPKLSLIVFLLDNHVCRTCLWGTCFLLPGRCLITSRPEGWSTPRSAGDGRHCFLLRPAKGCCSSNCRHWFVTCFYKWASAIYEKHFFFVVVMHGHTHWYHIGSTHSRAVELKECIMSRRPLFHFNATS